jgi:hypothetical protein
MTIEIPDQFEKWIQQNVITKFESAGITVSESAKNVLAYGLKAQLDDGIVDGWTNLASRAKLFSSRAVRTYKAIHGTADMNFNRSLHLLTNLNTITNLFPWDSTV